MKKKIAVGLATALLVASPAMASDVETKTSKPVTLTEQQMDSITAAGPMAYGKTIMTVTGGLSFGQLIGPAKKAGTAAHGSYPGGAKALVETVCVHVPSAC
jgi:hypothetical protein